MTLQIDYKKKKTLSDKRNNEAQMILWVNSSKHLRTK